MKKLSLALLLFVLPLLFLTGCRCPSCVAQEEAIIPSALLKKANKVVIEKTGEDFFEKYMNPDFSKIKHIPPNYYVVYHFFMPEKPYVNQFINFMINDSTGKLTPGMDVAGIPDCINDNCSFNINEEDAVKIAKDNGLEAGIKPWKKGLMWSSKLQQYVWDVISTLEGTEGSEGFRGNGKEVLIDPGTGLVLEMNDWYIK